jgi:hypothetical protein
MEECFVRAIVRGIDVTPKKTAWLPLAGENFTVVWETRSNQNGHGPARDNDG